MKIDKKVFSSIILGAALLFIFQSIQPSAPPLMPLAYAADSSQINTSKLSSCEVFFSDNRDVFEEEINNRLPKVKLLQSNVLFSETTKQIGFYALICY